MAQFPPQNPEDAFATDDFRRIVEKYLPAWKRACTTSDSEGIVLHELAFGSSLRELVLFACAIKFAAANGKNIHVVCGKADRSLSRKPSGPVYRDVIVNARPRKRKARPRSGRAH